MKKLVLFLMLVLIIPCVHSSIGYFSDRMNFPPGESRLHNQTLTNDGASAVVINATIPSGFSSAGTDCTAVNSTLVRCVVAAGSSKYYKMTSPGSCAEGTIYKSYLTSNSSFSEDFTFVCIPDDKITDCKVEYGHGDANYLDQLYISNETATIFNLVRVWNIGHYLSPDENALNATMECGYENYPVRTYGRVEIDYYPSGINGTYWWDEIEGGYWFRIGVVSQEVSGKSVGNYYDVDCSNLVYQYEHEQVVANSSTCDLEIRSSQPFTCLYTFHPVFTNKVILTLTNSEKYDTYDISFDKTLNGIKHTETYRQLESGRSFSYIVDNSSSANVTVFFIPSWYINSRNPKYYEQVVNCVNASPIPNTPPLLVQNIPDQAWQVNTNNTNAFDLDDYFVDIDADPINYSCDGVDNITIVIDADNNVSFIPDFNWTGTRNTTCYADDLTNVTPSNNFQLYVYNCGNSVVDAGEQCDGTNLSGQSCTGLGYAGGSLSCAADCSFDTSGCTSPPTPSGGGGKVTVPIELPEEPEEMKDIDLTIISYPDEISFDDGEFVVFVQVENKGNVGLSGIDVEAGNLTAWCSETQTIGHLGAGEKKILEMRFENCFCGKDSVQIDSFISISFIASVEGIWDVEVASLTMELPELTVLTDRKYYFEDDIMRLCIILNNTGRNVNKTELEYEINVYNDAEFIVDYLSPYSVPAGKVLVVVKDYWIHDVVLVDEYLIRAALYQRGDLFGDERYYLTEANTSVVLNGFIEDQILQGVNTVYEFKYENEQHSIFIEKFDEDFVYLSVSSKSKDYKIRLLEMVYIDLNGDDKDDISLTYLGIKAGKADVRIRLVPRKPLDIGGDSASYVLDLGEAAPVDLEPSKIVHIAKPIAYIFAVGAIIFLIFIVGRTIYKSYPEIFKKDKFLKFKLFKKTKKR